MTRRKFLKSALLAAAFAAVSAKVSKFNIFKNGSLKNIRKTSILKGLKKARYFKRL
jgi:hypothetical protein